MHNLIMRHSIHFAISASILDIERVLFPALLAISSIPRGYVNVQASAFALALKATPRLPWLQGYGKHTTQGVFSFPLTTKDSNTCVVCMGLVWSLWAGPCPACLSGLLLSSFAIVSVVLVCPACRGEGPRLPAVCPHQRGTVTVYANRGKSA